MTTDGSRPSSAMRATVIRLTPRSPAVSSRSSSGLSTAGSADDADRVPPVVKRDSQGPDYRLEYTRQGHHTVSWRGRGQRSSLIAHLASSRARV